MYDPDVTGQNRSNSVCVSKLARLEPPSPLKSMRKKSIDTRSDLQSDDSQNEHEKLEHQKDDASLEISGIRYVKEIGLIVTTFEGSIKILDNLTFKTLWHTRNKDRKPEFHATISSFDISHTLGLMVTGGDLGRILSVDPYGQGMLYARRNVSEMPITKVFIYEQ